jgi:hypothetical protein
MRWLRLCGLIIGLAAGCRPVPALAANAADGPGCLGVTVGECVGWLRATMILNESIVADALARRHQTDVNGKPLGGGLVTVIGRLPERMDQFVILLHLRPDDRVRSVEANLLYNLIEARTEPVYDRSGFYDIVWRLLGRRCPGITRIGLYRFFENSVKPRLTHQRQDFSSGLYGLHRVMSHAAGVTYCGGVTMAYTNRLDWRGSTDPESAAKRTQFSSIELQ